MTYLATVSSSILTNHIAHFAIFKDCVDGEIKKRSSVNESSVDILSWYNSVFPRSRVGEITVSNSYVSWVNELNRIIGNSNSKMTSPADGSFRYTDHQTKITKHLAKIGIALDRYPRNDFFEIEGQVFLLIDSINESFSFPEKLPRTAERRYF